MGYKVDFEPPKVVVIKFEGIVDAADFDHMFEEIVKKAKDTGTVDVLVDMSELENIPPEARKKARLFETSFPLKYNKVASFGGNAGVRILSNLMSKIIPRVGSWEFFKTEEDARAWLAE